MLYKELKNCIGKILLTDLSLWLGGVERLYNAGIEKLGVIHRGFSTYEKQSTNIPEWQSAIELKQIP
jgi:chorismate mutase